MDMLVFKIASDAVTAASGILGLLTDFKKAGTNKITRSGRIALAGIIVGLTLSTVISYAEFQSSAAAEEERRKEVSRLAHPVDIEHLGSLMTFRFVPDSSASDYAYRVYHHIKDHDPVDGSLKPLVEQPPSAIEETVDSLRDIRVFKKGRVDCSEANSVERVADTSGPNVYISPPRISVYGDPNTRWSISPNDGGLVMEVGRDLRVKTNDDSMTSRDDFFGATLVLESIDGPQVLNLQEVSLQLAPSIWINGTPYRQDNGGAVSYCVKLNDGSDH